MPSTFQHPRVHTFAKTTSATWLRSLVALNQGATCCGLGTAHAWERASTLKGGAGLRAAESSRPSCYHAAHREKERIMTLSGRIAFVFECAMAVSMAAGLAAAAGSTYYNHGKPIALTDSYACTENDILNDGKLVTVVAFSNGPMNMAALKAASDPCRELTHQIGKAFTTLVELKIKYDGTAYNVQVFDAEGTHSRNDAANLKLTKNDGKRIEGTYATRNASAKRSPNTEAFDLTFALDVAPSK
jgi:hypothetical protein